MRYLNKRDEFLKNYNNIVSIKEKYTPESKNNQLITEDSGPFANDIGWGDSLLGRLINSTIRKAKIGANLLRIKAVESRLREAMDELLLSTSVAELDENDKNLYARALISTYLIAIQEGVENGDPKSELVSLTESAIGAVNQNKDLEDKNELLRQLNEWLKFLNEFKEEEEEEGQEEGQASEEVMSATEAQFGNFKYLFNMLLIFKGIETERIEYNRVNTQKNNSGEVSKLLAEAEPLHLAFKAKKNKATFELVKTKIDEILKLDPANITAQKILNDIEIWSGKRKKKVAPAGVPTTTGATTTQVIQNQAAAGGTTQTATSGTTQAAAGGTNNATEKNGVKENEKVSLLKYDEFKRINEGVGKAIGGVVGKIWKFITGGKDERKLDKETENLWNSLNQIYKMFVHAGEVGENGVLSKDSQFHKFFKLTPEQINADPKLKLAYNRYKTNINKIYGFVRTSNGITEGVDEILGKSEEMGKKIATLYSVTKTKPEGNFVQYPGTVGEVWDELVENIKGFNKYMQNVLSFESKWKVGDKVTWKSEQTGNTISQEVLRIDGKKLFFKDKKGQEYTKLMSEVEKVEESVLYNSFGRIYEAQDESQDDVQNDVQDDTQTTTDDTEKNGEVSGWKNPNSVTRIQDWWGKKMDLKRWVLEKTEVEKVRVNLEKKLAEKKDSVVIDGMDPVLEIVKVFNRAYKLHTSQVIPGGRTGGKVSNKTFLEYHCFGNGSPANAGESGGPYRNNAIFNQWEDCVNNVKKDKRYQCIFNVGTKLKVGNEYIEKAGMNLRKFMTDMLDGDELYKSGTSADSKGAQSKFLDKYFGYKSTEDGKDTYYSDNDRDTVTDLANSIDTVELSLENGFSTGIEIKDIKDLKYTFFSLLVEVGGGNPQRYYFQIQDVKDNYLYLNYSKTAYYMKEVLRISSRTTVKLDKDMKESDPTQNDKEPWEIFATRVKFTDLFTKDGKFLTGEIKIESLVKKTDDKTNNKTGEIKVVSQKTWTLKMANHIVDLSKGSTTADFKRAKANQTATDKTIDEHGGFKNISLTQGITQVNITR
jgi:hypothetical protein